MRAEVIPLAGRHDRMIRIAISVEALEAIARTLALGSVGYENATNERGERYAWLPPTWSTSSGPCAGPARATAM